MLAGGYLGLWVLIFSAPDHVLDGTNWAFAKRDLVQQQHLVISLLSVAGGCLEILWTLCGAIQPGRLTFRHHSWHLLWFLNMSSAGIMFLVHPQHREGTPVHTFLGMCMAWAACFLMLSKIKGFPPNIDEDFTILLSGISQLIVVFLLLVYKEEPQEIHTGVDIKCHGAWPITIFGYSFASFTFGLIILRMLQHLFPSCFRTFTNLQIIFCNFLDVTIICLEAAYSFISHRFLALSVPCQCCCPHSNYERCETQDSEEFELGVEGYHPESPEDELEEEKEYNGKQSTGTYDEGQQEESDAALP
mmetsp:Transcript_4854/g.7205  ORF Transcript_4854/g.7205 Transcript_4854/m.7205 type:complete len:303 (+) Transcript_4854:85-993(+)